MKIDALLIQLNQECAEVVQIATKIQEYGPDSYHPQDPLKTSNRVLLSQELGNLKALIDIFEKNYVNEEEFRYGQSKKLDNLSARGII